MYYEEVAGFEEDGLQASSQIVSVMRNVEVSSAVVRGHLICKANGKWSPVTENADAQKPLAIAARDFSPSEENAVTQAYVRGVFNVEKVFVGADPPYSLGRLNEVEVLVGEAIDYAAFEQGLRTQGIYLTSLREG